MYFEFYPKNLEKRYTNSRVLRKEYGEKIEYGMMMFLGSVEAADSAWDIWTTPMFHMEHLKNNMRKYYSVLSTKRKANGV